MTRGKNIESSKRIFDSRIGLVSLGRIFRAGEISSEVGKRFSGLGNRFCRCGNHFPIRGKISGSRKVFSAQGKFSGLRESFLGSGKLFQARDLTFLPNRWSLGCYLLAQHLPSGKAALFRVGPPQLQGGYAAGFPATAAQPPKF